MGFIQTAKLDANAGETCSEVLTVIGENTAAVQVTTDTGSFSAAVLTVEGSIDSIKWVSVGTTITADGITSAINVGTYRFIRVRVSTANGAALLLTVSILSKNIP